MCISDWRLGRLIRKQITPFGLAAAGTASVGASRQRVGLMICAFGSAAGANTGGQITTSGTVVGLVGNATPIIQFTLDQNGDFCQEPFTVTATAATTLTGCFVEMFLPEDVITAGIEQFYSEFAQWVKRH